jgi:acetyl-CoA decarbonylase/synthase, CODH/ACS complex subunit delta
MPVEIPKEKWPGTVRTITLGATASEGGTRTRTVVVGGEKALPYLHFEGEIPHRPVVAMEIKDRKPEDWSPLLLQTLGDAALNPDTWAMAAEAAGADLLVMSLSQVNKEGKTNTASDAVKAVKAVLAASGLPLIVLGPDQPDLDNELLVAVAENTQGERLVLGICEDKNYRTIVATALANGHLVTARSPMDVNLAKQLNILINDMGMPFDRILVDPTTGVIGYGIEYGFSVMERFRLAALQGDAMVQSPMVVTTGSEAWKIKESKVGSGVPESWGDWFERAVNWETMSAVAQIQAGADIIIVRHPESVKRLHAVIDELMANPQ